MMPDHHPHVNRNVDDFGTGYPRGAAGFDRRAIWMAVEAASATAQPRNMPDEVPVTFIQPVPAASPATDPRPTRHSFTPVLNERRPELPA